MRATRLTSLLLLLATGIACRSGTTVPEDGAVLLRIERAGDAPAPDELRVWVYDRGGRLWNDVRIPAEGALPNTGTSELGTVLIQPGPVQGKLRIHVRGLVASTRVLDGTLSVDPRAAGDRTFDLVLDTPEPIDDDHDGVPDSFDDCVGVANPGQGGCEVAPVPDAGPSADVPADEGADAGPAGEGDGAPATEDLADVAPVPDAAFGPEAVLAPEVGADGPPPAEPDLRPRDVLAAGDVDVRGADQTDATDTIPPDLGRDSGDGAAERADSAADVAEVGRDVTADVAPDQGGVDGGCDGACGTKSQGALCAANGECASGFCADGVCCTNACIGRCRSCNQPSANGVCQGYPAGTDPEVECSGGETCNGVGACGTVTNPNLTNGQLCTAGIQCQSGQCVDGVCCDSKCDQPCETCGSGTCQPVKKADDVPQCTGSKTCNPTGKCVDRPA